LVKSFKASGLLLPQIQLEAVNFWQTSGKLGCPQMVQWFSLSKFTHLTPAGFPEGIPGRGLEIEGAIQQAPQPIRHSMI